MADPKQKLNELIERQKKILDAQRKAKEQASQQPDKSTSTETVPPVRFPVPAPNK